MICLDTNAAIAAMKGEPRLLVRRIDRAVAEEGVALSVIVLFELRFGVARSKRGQENAERLADFLTGPIEVLPFEPEDAEEAGAIRAALHAAGTPIGPYDVLIAAQARRRGAVLVTANEREFARVPGLRTENWEAER